MNDASDALKNYVAHRLSECRETLTIVQDAPVALATVAELRVLSFVENLLEAGRSPDDIRNDLRDAAVAESSLLVQNSDPLRVQMVAFLGDLAHRLSLPPNIGLWS